VLSFPLHHHVQNLTPKCNVGICVVVLVVVFIDIPLSIVVFKCLKLCYGCHTICIVNNHD
jgi:hypothetical protein